MFPAYSKISQESKDETSQVSKEFLQNPSYDTIPVTSSTVAQPISSSSESESEGEIYAKAVQNYVRQETPPKVELFYIDKDRKKDYLKLDTLPNRAVPFYRVPRYFKRFAQSNRGVFKRYFKVKRLKKLTHDPKRLIDEKASKDEELRLYLVRNSSDVDKWLEYIEYAVSDLKVAGISSF